ncbi:hypothetical protein HB364_30705 [Pseudoflavitalea sp. X16]|uniref:hypothetical protein n=1 Tax=Paraflavitalea devenefica TaxID=2716334 RepID=UPI0014211D0A|nr:hypothetical protein [Paraflavitalea devenefica]NII29490.1 hypothetical protein [Paraflavitalea devenefica]
MRFAIAGEGLTDFAILKNLLIGFTNEKNLPVRRLLPELNEPFGWSNLFDQLSKDRFRGSFELNDYIIVQIDSGTCEDWKEGLKHIGDDESLVEGFVNQIIQVLIKRIGEEFYTKNKQKIIFAVAVHDIECWVLPFISEKASDQSKMVNCFRSAENIANKKGFSLNQKNYREGKYYDDLSKGMTKQKDLLKLYKLNPSLRIFVDKLIQVFPDKP